MGKLIKLLLFFAILGAIGFAAYKPALKYWKDRGKVTWETSKVTEGDMTRFVNSTGNVRPVLSVSIGSFVSGPIVELNVDHNDQVTKGQILAEVDPRLFKANVDRDEATLASREAEVERIEAQLRQSLNNYQRGQKLREKNEGFMSAREMDALVAEVKSLQAQRKLAKASIKQAAASLETSRANLNYCKITSPVDGVVVKRAIEPGQTLAAQFQTPELFVVAPDLREKVHVFASVDEADIGLIQQAEKERRPVTFTVDAHPDDVFTGKIEQIRLKSNEGQVVVTYPVVIAASNPDLKLLPDMTAEISFEVDARTSITKIPRAAIAFLPTDVSHVRKEDQKLIDGSAWKSDPDGQDPNASDDQELSANERAKAKQKRKEKHVWIKDGEKLRAVKVVVGIDDGKYYEMISGDLKVGDELVTSQEEG